MAVKITVHNKRANDIMDIVSELRTQGLIQGADFDFAYHQNRWDEMVGEIPAYTFFTFYTEKYATLFALKYGS